MSNLSPRLPDARPPPPVLRPGPPDSFVALAIDKSGSMSPVKADVVRMVRDFVFEQRTIAPSNTDLKIVFFSDSVEQAYAGPLYRAPMSLETYKPYGGTAIRDALGECLKAAEGAGASRVTVAIVTDGCENASYNWTEPMLTEQIAVALHRGWQILFLATDDTALSTARRWGIPENSCARHGNRPATWTRMSRVLNDAVQAQVTGRMIGFTAAQRALLLEHKP